MQAQRAVIAAIELQPGVPLVQQIVDQLSNAICQGGLPHGAKLPPIRELAELLSVGKSTVVDALDHLRAKGLVVSRQGSGHYVHRSRTTLPSAAAPDLQPQDTLSVVRRAVLLDNGALRPGCGFLPSSWLPAEELLKAVRGTLRASALRMGEYGVTGGYLPLRQALRVKLATFGIEAPVEQIITTANTMQGIDLLMRLLLKPGDSVLLDDPCYFNMHTNLALHGAKVVTIARQCDGIDMDAFEQQVIAHKPVLYLTNSTLHNPTGHSFSPAQAYRLLELSHRHGFHIRRPATTPHPAPRRQRPGQRQLRVRLLENPDRQQPRQLRGALAATGGTPDQPENGLRRRDLGIRRANHLHPAQQRQLRQTHAAHGRPALRIEQPRGALAGRGRVFGVFAAGRRFVYLDAFTQRGECRDAGEERPGEGRRTGAGDVAEQSGGCE